MNRPEDDIVRRPSRATGRSRNPEEREWTYDPRREARRKLARVPLPDDVQASQLDRDVQKELRGLAPETSELVAKHLVVAGRLIDDDPQQALLHARAARALAGRVAAVREANGLVAYTAGEWTEALSELRTARRLSGDPEHLPVMADCERALGRPDRALLVADDPQAASLSPAARVELLIVTAGARRDLGQVDAAVVSLQVAALEGPVRPWTVRLRYAYADALVHAGREDEARLWFSRVMDIDEQGDTDAEERLLEFDGMVLEDLEDLEGPDTAHRSPTTLSAADLAALVADMSSNRPHEEGGRHEPVVGSVSAGPAFSTPEPPPVEVVRAPVAAPGFREPPAASPGQSPAKGQSDDELRLFE